MQPADFLYAPPSSAAFTTAMSSFVIAGQASVLVAPAVATWRSDEWGMKRERKRERGGSRTVGGTAELSRLKQKGKKWSAGKEAQDKTEWRWLAFWGKKARPT